MGITQVRRFAIAAVSAVLAMGAALALHADSHEPEVGAPYSLFAGLVAGDSAAERPAPALEGCVRLGRWGDDLSEFGLSSWLQGPFPSGAGYSIDLQLPDATGDEFEVILVDVQSDQLLRTPLDGNGAERSGSIYLAQNELGRLYDVYLCRKPRAAQAAAPEIRVLNLNPLAVEVMVPPGQTWVGGLSFETGPGLSEVIPPLRRDVSLDEEIGNSTIVEIDETFPGMPVIRDALRQVSPVQQVVFTPLMLAPLPEDRTGIVTSLVSPNAFWNGTFVLSIDGGDTFGFPAPTIVVANQSRIFTLILPDNVIPGGTTVDDIDITLFGGSPVSQAPAAAHVFPLPPTLAIDPGAGDDAYTIRTQLVNPTDQTVTLTNDSIGMALTNCLTGDPFETVRTTLNGTIPPGGTLPVTIDGAQRQGLPNQRPPDPPRYSELDPNDFVDVLYAFATGFCVEEEDRAAVPQ